jgi:hypothetical protein
MPESDLAKYHLLQDYRPTPLESRINSPFVETVAFLEKASTHPRDGRVGAFNYGHHSGMLQGLLIALQIPYTLVTPKEWQRELHRGTDGGETKSRSIEACEALFPQVNLRPVKKIKAHDGMAEALLIAVFAQRCNLGLQATAPAAAGTG